MNSSKQKMFAIYVVGYIGIPVALFAEKEYATEWAREYHFGNWLMREVEIPEIPFATREELEEAKKRTEHLAELFIE